jgi:hypothetical protein
MENGFMADAAVLFIVGFGVHVAEFSFCVGGVFGISLCVRSHWRDAPGLPAESQLR